MADFVSDTFEDTDGTPLEDHTPTLGGAWGDEAPGLTILNNAVVNASSGDLAHSHNAETPLSADYGVQAVVSLASAGDGPSMGVTARGNGSDLRGYYAGYYPSAGAFRLYKNTFGWSQLGSDYDDSIGTGDSRTLELRVFGDSIQLAVDGIVRIDETDSEITDAGYAGVWSDVGDAGSIFLHTFSAGGADPPGTHSSLTESGMASLDGLEWLSVEITARPSRIVHGAANPQNFYHMGMLSWGTVNGAMTAHPVTRDLELIQIPSGMTALWYQFAPGVIATVVELETPA